MTNKPPTILLVDDETHVVHVVRLALENAGYRIISAEDGETALSLALKERPDLLITDHLMPGLSGHELCEKLLQDPATASIPALMLTARTFRIPNDPQRCSNIAAVIGKPFSLREILQWIHQLLDPPLDGEQGRLAS